MPRRSVNGLLIRVPAGLSFGIGARQRLQAGGLAFDLEPLLRVSGESGMGLAGEEMQWHLARPAAPVDGAHPWDLAHESLAEALGLAAGAPVLVEPDLEQEWFYDNPVTRDLGFAASKELCQFNDQESKGGLPTVQGEFAWHLMDDRSQLRAARQLVGEPPDGERVRIAHVDTGWDPSHQARPLHVREDLQRNFIEGETPGDARDPGQRQLLKNPGHGTGTLSILAGGRFKFGGPHYAFDDFLGGAPQAEVVPIRAVKSVVQVLTSGIAKGIQYATDRCAEEAFRIHVLSMSLGGVASQAWADAVNNAYEAGIVLVAAAGNNISAGIFGFPTHFIVYPARFRRVIAACGVMANRRPYYGLPVKFMQGNWGPQSKMATAMSAYTPNIAWAELGCAGIVDMDGGGTSSATPQVASAAALYLQHHRQVLFDKNNYPEMWLRVEAVRHALFTAADKSADSGSQDRLGNGILQTAEALRRTPPKREALGKSRRDSAIFPFLRVLTGLGFEQDTASQMLALEATQLAQEWHDTATPNPLETVVPDPDVPHEAITPVQARKYLEGLIQHPMVSERLKSRAKEVHSALGGGPVPRGEPAQRKTARWTPSSTRAPEVPAPVGTSPGPEPPYRRLRVFSIDPALSTRLEMAPISEAVVQIPWEKLLPGPVGEYLEVVDIDPPSGCYYQAVDLDQPNLLAQDGLPLSEGTPQFHQQMVYAVASLTIRNFERALGRRVLWRPRPAPPDRPKDDSVFVQRLRIYPHALRDRNAYYSPAKIALLFGYFPAAPEATREPASGMVFTCLSHDIVAHETTHAILDGMHRRFSRGTNPDVLAFHEAFADIVALFQHFTFPSIMKQQLASTRGNIREHESILGQLAGQFAQTSGLRRSLRDAIGKEENGVWKPQKPDPTRYAEPTEPHERGAILVAAVFDAFLSIYERRTADLMRIATGGTGILAPGAIHPDLVGRLCDEASRSAEHVLTMCIRALDYCPPVDLTFGEYLRAIVTADNDVVKDDDLRYRVAFLEAFRRRGIHPQDVRVLSLESLLWRTPDTEDVQPSTKLESSLEQLRDYAGEHLFAESLAGDGLSRERIFQLERGVRRRLHQWLEDHFHSAAEGESDAKYLGLDGNQSFEVHCTRFALRAGPDGNVVPQVIITLLQETRIPASETDPDGPTIAFTGGSTIVADLRRRKICYCVRKNATSINRRQRQQEFELSRQSLRTTYFGPESNGEAEPFALLHRGL